MKLLIRIFRSSDFWPVITVLFFGFLASRAFFSAGYFKMHDDLQMMRQLEMEKCFADLQIPCRWVPDMGYGFGFPLFNFYPPLPYLVGEIFRSVGFSFVDTVKLTFALSFFLSGITMYLLSKEFFGRLGGVLSSIFYIWAPYHSVDVYVRGAMNEAWALVWFPLILWTSYRLIQDTRYKIRWFVGLALSWTGLLLSHNLMILIFTPVFAGWCLLFLWWEKRWNRIFQLVISGVLAFGLAAFFTLPAVLEQKYVQVNTLVTGYYEYIAHYATLNQLLFSRFWGYGPSIWGPNDGMSFQIGQVHWIFSLILLVLFGFRYIKTRKIDIASVVVFFFLAVGWFAAFMTHSRSTPIWQAIPPFKFIQFPWRFLTIVIFAFSFIAGSFTFLIKNLRFLKVASGLLVSLLLILNWNYFLPDGGKMGPLTDKEKFSGAAWELQQTAGIYDYLPTGAKEAPKEPRKVLAETIQGDGLISDMKQGTNWAEFKIVASGASSTVRINIFKFPNWKIFIDGKEVESRVPSEEKWGRMWIEVPKGTHKIYAKLYDTPIRIVANTISLVSWIALVSFPLWRRKLFFG